MKSARLKLDAYLSLFFKSKRLKYLLISPHLNSFSNLRQAIGKLCSTSDFLLKAILTIQLDGIEARIINIIL